MWKTTTTIVLLIQLLSSPHHTSCQPSSSSRLLSSGAHHDNHAIIISTSKFYHNYRHASNALTVYQKLKSNGFSDSNIILMLADDIPCDARNPYPNHMYSSRSISSNNNGGSAGSDLYSNVELDYRGNDVSVDNLLRLMSNKHHPNTPPNRKLQTTSKSNVFLYLTGHGGDEFFKFSDREEFNSQDLASVISHMKALNMYHQMMVVLDTCQAFTMCNQLSDYSVEGVTCIGSSLKDENSYAHHANLDVGVSVIDRFTFWWNEFMKKSTTNDGGGSGGKGLEGVSVRDWLDYSTYNKLASHAGVTVTNGGRNIANVPMSDFFVAKNNKNKNRKEGSTVLGMLSSSGTHTDNITTTSSTIATMEGETDCSSERGRSTSFSNVAQKVQHMIYHPISDGDYGGTTTDGKNQPETKDTIVVRPLPDGTILLLFLFLIGAVTFSSLQW